MALPTKRIFGLIVLFNFTTSLFCQEVLKDEFYNIFDQIISVENTDVYQGVLFTAEFLTNKDKTEFFKNLSFTKGSIFYGGQAYNNLDLKYDVSNDRVFLRLTEKAGGGGLILFNEILQKFDIDNHRFVKIDSKMAPEIANHGFYEIASESSLLTLFIKHSKKRIRQIGKKSVYFDYINKPSNYVLFYNNKYHEINSKKEIKSLFPDFKKETDKFYNDVRRLRKSNPDGFQVALINRFVELISQQVSKK